MVRLGVSSTKMKTRDIVAGLAVLVLLTTGILVYKNSKKGKISLPSATPNFQTIESKFPSVSIPQNADRIELKSVSGGEENGEAARNYQNGKFTITVLANLPTGSYTAVAADASGSQINLGKLTLSKGGYLVDFTSTRDLTSYKKVVVVAGKTNILEGSF